MAELMLAIFGLAIPVAQSLFKLHSKLEQIADAPNDVELFKNETFIPGMSVNTFQMQCPASLAKLTKSKRHNALVLARALVDHFDLIMKSTKAATDLILSTFDEDLGAFGQLWARIKWTFKKPAIAEARRSMALFFAIMTMFTTSVIVESLLHENAKLRRERGVSSKEILHKLDLFGYMLKQDRARIRGVLYQRQDPMMADSAELQRIERTAKTIDRKAKRVIGSLPSRPSDKQRASKVDRQPISAERLRPGVWEYHVEGCPVIHAIEIKG